MLGDQAVVGSSDVRLVVEWVRQAADGIATLRTTLEYGEAQRRASPDAVGLRWLWRTGPRPATVATD